MDVIDKGIIQELNEQAEVLYGQYKKIQKEIQEILSIEVVREMDVNQFVDNIWKEFYERGFMKNLKDYMQEISLQKDKEFLVFTEKIQEIIRESPSLLPSEDELLNDLGAGGHNRPNEVLCKHMDCLRTNFTKQFLRLDELVLENFVKEFKCRIVDIFAEDGINCGRLKYICPYDEMAEKEKWFGLLVNCVFSKEEYEQLKTAFEVLDNFQISVRGFFMHRIRQGLDRLDPNNCNIEKYKNPEDNAWAILRELEVNLQKVCEELENILSTDELFKDPTM